MKLVDFYTNVITSLGLHVEDGYIFTSDSEDRELVREKDLPIVIPTKEHMSTLIDKDSNEVCKIPFNPLQEDILAKGESVSAKKIRLAVKLRLTHTITAVSKLLLKLASDVDNNKKVKYELNKFLSSLAEASTGKKIKHEVDETSIKNWMKIIDHFDRKDSLELIKIFTTKAGTVDGVKYNRVISVHSPILDILSDENTDKDTEINGTTLRPKDIVVFKLMLKFILTELNENNVLQIGNNDEHRPVFIGMMQLYIILTTRINKLAKLLTYVDSVDSDEAHTDLEVTLEDLDDLNKFNGVVKTIPSDKALHKMTEVDEEEVSLSALNKRNAETHSVLDSIVNRKEREPISERPRREVEVDDEPSAIDAILGRKPVRETRSDSRYSPERIYERAPEYNYTEREREAPTWGSIRPKPRLSERLEARYSRGTRRSYGRDSYRDREPIDHRPAGYRGRI
jgi:hypothetical protein